MESNSSNVSGAIALVGQSAAWQNLYQMTVSDAKAKELKAPEILGILGDEWKIIQVD